MNWYTTDNKGSETGLDNHTVMECAFTLPPPQNRHKQNKQQTQTGSMISMFRFHLSKFKA